MRLRRVRPSEAVLASVDGAAGRVSSGRENRSEGLQPPEADADGEELTWGNPRAVQSNMVGDRTLTNLPSLDIYRLAGTARYQVRVRSSFTNGLQGADTSMPKPASRRACSTSGSLNQRR